MPGREGIDMKTRKGRVMGFLAKFAANGRRLSLALAVLPLVLLASPAGADQLDSLRAAGVIGEANNGLLVLRDSGASSDARALVDKVNGQRRAIYQKRANEQGVPADQVGQLYTPYILKEAPPGTWYQDPSGNWQRK